MDTTRFIAKQFGSCRPPNKDECIVILELDVDAYEHGTDAQRYDMEIPVEGRYISHLMNYLRLDMGDRHLFCPHPGTPRMLV